MTSDTNEIQPREPSKHLCRIQIARERKGLNCLFVCIKAWGLERETPEPAMKPTSADVLINLLPVKVLTLAFEKMQEPSARFTKQYKLSAHHPDHSSFGLIGGPILAGCLAVTIWDILCFFKADIALVFLHRFTWKTAIFLVARLAPLGYFFTITIFTVGTNVDCDTLQHAFRTLLVLARPSTTLLLLFRVDAVYNQNTYMRSFLAAVWLATLGAFILLAVEGIVPTEVLPYCFAVAKPALIAPAAILQIANDTLSCLAILYNLGGGSWKERLSSLKKVVRPNHSCLTDLFVQDTILYSILAIFANIITAISCSLFVPPFYSGDVAIMVSHPGAVAVNLIALRIYRNLKLGKPGLVLPTVNSATFQISNIVFTSPITREASSVHDAESSFNTEGKNDRG
ncbi:hypothetical protein CPB83DRAFT_895699 [Crepidotus variabilis]|uniref:Uncharacterized protein n=1 Tax=Crepidotus variabilis TaxID=179855 RepID=A0A9P6JNI7_9AGAR|nr:hypothetical protein CPB83DRAFT_895699 [Crepidotus variabilis]